MPVPNRVRDDARAAEDALSALATTSDAAPAAASAPVDAQAPTAPETAQTAEPVAQAPDELALAKALRESEDRYRALQGMFNKQTATADDLRSRVDMLTQLVGARPEPAQPEPVPDRFVSDKEREEFGEEMIDVVKRASREEWQPLIMALRDEVGSLKSLLQQMGAQVQSTASTATQTAQQRFQADMDTLVPDWRSKNVNQKFLDWLAQPDVFSGVQRLRLLQAAYEQLDVRRVAQFFDTFFEPSRTTTPSGANDPQASSVDPASLIAPGNAATPAQPSTPRTGKTWTMQEIDQVYIDKRKNRLTPQAFAQKEAEIKRALMEGRIKAD